MFNIFHYSPSTGRLDFRRSLSSGGGARAHFPEQRLVIKPNLLGIFRPTDIQDTRKMFTTRLEPWVFLCLDTWSTWMGMAQAVKKHRNMKKLLGQ